MQGFVNTLCLSSVTSSQSKKKKPAVRKAPASTHFQADVSKLSHPDKNIPRIPPPQQALRAFIHFQPSLSLSCPPPPRARDSPHGPCLRFRSFLFLLHLSAASNLTLFSLRAPLPSSPQPLSSPSRLSAASSLRTLFAGGSCDVNPPRPLASRHVNAVTKFQTLQTPPSLQQAFKARVASNLGTAPFLRSLRGHTP